MPIAMSKNNQDYKNKRDYFRTTKGKKSDRRWSMVDMELHNDKNLGGIHIGIMTHILAQSNDFVINKTQIRKRLKLPEKKFNDAWRELMEYGYILKKSLGKGKGVYWMINEIPYYNEESEDAKGNDTICTDANCTDTNNKVTTCTDTPLTITNFKTNTNRKQVLNETNTNKNEPPIAPSANFPQGEEILAIHSDQSNIVSDDSPYRE